MQNRAVTACWDGDHSLSPGVNPRHCVGRPDAVQVWWVATGSDDSNEASTDRTEAAWLTGAEWERAARFRGEADRRRFVRCRMALRQLLGIALGTPPDQVDFIEESYGKLVLKDPGANRRISFNVAHSGDWGCIALAGGPSVGVDVEGTRRPHNLELLAKKILTEEERSYWDGLPSGEQGKAFLRFWTLKEAVAKALGWGLRLPLARIRVHLGRPTVLGDLPSSGSPVAAIAAGELWSPQEGYYGALAIGAPSFPQIEVGMIGFQQELEEFGYG